MQVYQNKKILKYFLGILILAISMGYFCNLVCFADNATVYADGIEGGGASSGGTVTECYSWGQAYQGLCGDPPGSKGGGASWRIFRTDNGWGLDDYTGYGGNILKEGYKNKAMEACKGAGWFVSYGWDGRNGSHYGYSDYNFQVGPASRTGDDVISGAQYNSYNAKGYEGIVASNFPNNAKITAGTALQLYKVAINSQATSIPASTGYFCIDANEIMQKTLSGISVDTNGKEIGNNPNSKTVNNGSKATITAKDITDYEFLGWSESKTGTPSGGKDYTVQSLTQDKTVYAIYKQKEITVIPEDPVVNDDPSAEGRTISNGEKIWTRPGLEKIVTFRYGITYSCINELSWSTDLVVPTHSMLRNDKKLSKQLASDNCNGLSVHPTQSVSVIAGNSDVGTSTRFSKQINVNIADRNVSSSTKTATSSVVVDVPYNFNNSIKIESGDNYVYAGASINIQSTVSINKKKNQLVGGDDYATIVRNAQIKYIVDQNGSVTEVPIGISNSTLNADSRLSGKQEKFSQTIPVQDLPAGSQVCITAAVYPASSGADSNLDANGNNEWAYSEPTCVVVAKKPLFQVWGGSVYSAGDIATKISQKVIDDKTRLYGSWVELSLVADKNNDGLASGASLASESGGDSFSFCNYNPLTIANQGCYLGNAGIRIKKSKKESLLANFTEQTETVSSNQVSGISNFSGVKILKSSGDSMTITENIILNNIDMETINQAPILFIYSKNINISCSVNRIDAILIAENTIDTCYDASEDMTNKVALNSQARSNQLIINGTMIADYLKLGRTYGASTGKNSGVPAEIINASTGIYLWGMQNNEGSDRLYTVYLRELSPRY